MTQEDKTLLLADLCARLTYGVKILHTGWDDEWDDEISTVERVVGIDDKFIYTKVIDMHRGGEEYRDDKWPIDTFDDKLFLRPMSSMTEEEFEQLKEYSELKYEQLDLASYHNGAHKCLDFYLSEVPSYVVILVFDWLNKNHFDYRGLIERGLAIAVTEENNPYKD